MRKLTKEEWVNKCKLVHGDNYDYSISEYKNATTKTDIKCKKHNIIFSITPIGHETGRGCPVCRYEKMAEKQKMPLNEFIEKANEIHNNKYDYSKVEYLNNRTKVCIICPEHGEFWQTPEKHILRKQGCPYCSGNARKTTEEFVKKANEIHFGKYDYSKTEYKCNSSPVKIVCPIHGEFYQRPKDHINGQGCPHCKQSKIEKEVFSFLISNNIDFEPQYRYDENNLKNRLDFFLPKYNIAIECQGEQHFKPVDFANKGKTWAVELFNKNIKYDIYKKSLCEDKGIKLIYYIPKKNTVPGYKSNSIFCGLYNKGNVSNNLQSLKKSILQ